MTATSRLEQALSALAAAHEQDPKQRRTQAGDLQPVEQVWCDTVSRWVRALVPEPSAALVLAAAAQHLERWRHPRSDWPEGRAGYLRWRRHQQQEHARRAAEILANAGIEQSLIDRVGALLQKRRLQQDPEAQLLEDAACLAFLELDLSDFAMRHERQDVLRILRRTWVKMSPHGQQAALQMKLDGQARELIEAALAEPAGD